MRWNGGIASKTFGADTKKRRSHFLTSDRYSATAISLSTFFSRFMLPNLEGVLFLLSFAQNPLACASTDQQTNCGGDNQMLTFILSIIFSGGGILGWDKAQEIRTGG